MLLAYLKRQYKLLLLLVGAVCIFAVVFALYDLPLEAVVYAGGAVSGAGAGALRGGIQPLSPAAPGAAGAFAAGG